MTSRYRLAPMRDVRTREEHVRRGDLAASVQEARVLAESAEASAGRVLQLRKALADATRERDHRLAQGEAAATIAHLEHYLRRLRRDLDAARAQALRDDARSRGQLEAVDAARTRLTVARAERELIERHFARWRTERRKLAERRED